MGGLQVGDTARMINIAGIPLSVSLQDALPQVSVLEIKPCEDGNSCPIGGEVFRFKDPETGDDDWMHTSGFEVVPRRETS